MRCAGYYHSGELTPKCLVADPTDQAANRACIRVPLECRKHNAVYNILHYLVDDEFMPPNVSISYQLILQNGAKNSINRSKYHVLKFYSFKYLKLIQKTSFKYIQIKSYVVTFHIHA